MLSALSVSKGQKLVTDRRSPPIYGAAVDASVCPLCGGPNGCQLCTSIPSKEPCWCMSAQIPEALLQRVPAELRNRSCICRCCVEAFHSEQRQRSSGRLLPGDYYYDTSHRLVFTAEYHLRRGYCCGSGCRHCPYPPVP